VFWAAAAITGADRFHEYNFLFCDSKVLKNSQKTAIKAVRNDDRTH